MPAWCPRRPESSTGYMGTGATDAVAASRVWKLNPGLSQNQLMLLATEPAVGRRWELLCFVFEMTQCNGKGCVLYNGQQRDCFIEILLQSKRINKSEDNSKVLNFYFFYYMCIRDGNCRNAIGESCFSPFIMWVPGTKFRLLGLAPLQVKQLP